MATRVLVIDNYDSFVYNLVQYLGELRAEPLVHRNDELSVDELVALEPDAVLVSPGPGTPDDAGMSNAVITTFAGRVPVLGVCLGHQCIGQVFGGRIVRAPRIMHGKTSKIFHDEKGLYTGVENPFIATRYHSLVIQPDSMPDTLEVTSKTWEDEIMGVRLKARGATLEGVQFHPESIMTTAGKSLLKNFLGMAAG